MKNRVIKSMAAVLTAVMLIPGSVSAANPQTQKQAVEEAPEQVLRNTVFTTQAQMRQWMGNQDATAWSGAYLTEVERYYWNFAPQSALGGNLLSMDVASNAYQNLEMFLDNGYLLDYQTLAAYTADYLDRKAEMTGSYEEARADAYYRILTDCLKNPYLQNKPEAVVTDTTYNGRDYSAVFDPDYYYDNNPDLQLLIGFNPPQLLRHFVEKGITEGRRGNATFDMDGYMAALDAQVALARSGMQAPGAAPIVTKYSYSRANYYGKLLGHYDYTDIFAPVTADAEEENQADW